MIMAHVTESKKKKVKEMQELLQQYPIIGILNMENLPAAQLQTMRAELRDKVVFYMTKKTLIKLALEHAKKYKPGIEKLEEYLSGMPCLLLTKESPFKLARTLQKSKAPAPAKSGQIAPRDIIIPAGPTPFAPGPVISELSNVGLNVGVVQGKVAIKEDSIIVHKGEKISQKVAEVLTRLDIKPMTVGLDLVVAYEGGVMYGKDVLEVDEAQFKANVEKAARGAFNLAFYITYATKDTITLLIGKAFNDAKGLGISQDIMEKELMPDLIGKAQRAGIHLMEMVNLS